MSLLSPSPRSFFRGTLLTLAILLGGCASGAPGATATGSSPAAGASPREIVEARVTESRVEAHVAFLASDAMRGRDTPSPELDRAADYLADAFRAAGLAPAGDRGSFLQRWPYRHMALDPTTSEAGGRAGTTSLSWRYAEDYFAIPGPDSRMAGAPFYLPTPQALSAGLPAEARGRPLLAYLPEGLGPDFGAIVQGALTAGASGVVLILNEGTPASEFPQLADALEAGAAGELPLPVAGLRFDRGAALLREAGVEEPGVGGGRILEGIDLGIRSTFGMRVDSVPNVVAHLQGSDPELASTFIVLTAHFDHVGVGMADATGDSIFNGADDNASGTAVLLLVAEALAALPTPPARSILFLAVSGEEKGLLGSQHFATTPTVDLARVVANLNMDMVGRNHPDTIIGVGTDYTTIGAVARRVAAERPELGLVLAPDPAPEEQIFLRSDHFSFVQAGIPAFMLTTWLHEDYHAQSDDPDTLDAEKTARVARMIFYLTLELASDPVAPSWTPEGEALLGSITGF